MAHDHRNRITFHEDLEIMEIDFTDLNFADSTEVNQMYDLLEESIAESGEDKWFFLVNYSGTRIDSSAWFAFSHRGRDLNLAHSQGSVRLDAGEDTKKEIERRANTDEFDANLHATREGALQRITTFKSQRLAKVVHEENMTREELKDRVIFLTDDQIMEIDFSNLTFKHSDDVNLAYDYIHECVDEAGPKWFFLVNYENCHIYPEAWIPYSQRGKVLNIDHSLGSVRYAPGSEEEEEIRMRAESQEFRPNIRNTREEALERIAEMKAEA
ncbi:MAG: hypothetical protein GY947_06895 [Rhodobacteraceae bacterium]|nr:hypothetical protein [Paracoccaceae bacterium]